METRINDNKRHYELWLYFTIHTITALFKVELLVHIQKLSTSKGHLHMFVRQMQCIAGDNIIFQQAKCFA